ncbi:MAG: hypothetical protein BroJett003_16710 [Planctomycetota bacterium]|nr:MAG: hypothetical protein BroJett003_16710 [Planctomycetota bacterium]
MESKRTDSTPSQTGKDLENKNQANCTPCTDTPRAVENTDYAKKGAAIGSAIGHAAGVAKDAAVSAVGSAKDAILGAKNAKPLNPSDEHDYWRKNLQSRPYFVQGTSYEQYGPAFQYGWQTFTTSKGRTFNDVEPQLGRDWESHRGTSTLSWSQAKAATHDAWQRVEKGACDVACG